MHYTETEIVSRKNPRGDSSGDRTDELSQVCDAEMDIANNKKEKVKRVNLFLKALPHLEFTETGLKNICNRFGITQDELGQMIQVFKKELKTNNDG